MPHRTNPFPDSEEIAALRRRLIIHRRNLYRLEEQKARYGLDVPLRILNEIAEQEEAIAQIEARLAELERHASASQTGSPTSQPDRGGTTYHIHIERAQGLAIGDGAQVVPTGSEPGVPVGESAEETGGTASRDQRCADLAANIRETLDLIREYEETRRLADDPKAKRRAEREIADLRSQLAAYRAEYRELGCE